MHLKKAEEEDALHQSIERCCGWLIKLKDQKTNGNTLLNGIHIGTYLIYEVLGEGGVSRDGTY